MKWMGGGGGEISDHVNNVLVREAIKEILGNFGHRQKMGGGGGGGTEGSDVALQLVRVLIKI